MVDWQIDANRPRRVTRSSLTWVPPRAVDIGVGINGLQLVWKLSARSAPLEGTRPAAIYWYHSSSRPIAGSGFSLIGSGGPLWLYQNKETDDQMLLGTHVDDFLLASTSLMLAQAFALYFGK